MPNFESNISLEIEYILNTFNNFQSRHETSKHKTYIYIRSMLHELWMVKIPGNAAAYIFPPRNPYVTVVAVE